MVFRAQLPASPAMGAGEEANRGKKNLAFSPSSVLDVEMVCVSYIHQADQRKAMEGAHL